MKRHANNLFELNSVSFGALYTGVNITTTEYF